MKSLDTKRFCIITMVCGIVALIVCGIWSLLYKLIAVIAVLEDEENENERMYMGSLRHGMGMPYLGTGMGIGKGIGLGGLDTDNILSGKTNDIFSSLKPRKSTKGFDKENK